VGGVQKKKNKHFCMEIRDALWVLIGIGPGCLRHTRSIGIEMSSRSSSFIRWYWYFGAGRMYENRYMLLVWMGSSGWGIWDGMHGWMDGWVLGRGT